MSNSFSTSDWRFIFPLLIAILGNVNWLHAQNERKTPANTASVTKELAPATTISRTVDLEKTVSFSLTLGTNNQTNILFNGQNKPSIQIADPESDKVQEIITNEFGNASNLDGVVINVAKNVKYPVLNSLFRNIRGAMDQNKINKPIYVAVQDPLANQADDQPTTQEFVIKHKKAAELYDRVFNVSKLFKVTVRLDPARNSITAKGPASKIKAIQNLIAALDRPAGATVDPNKKIKPIIVEENKTPNNNSNNSNPAPTPDGNPNNNDGNNSTPKMGASKNVPDRSFPPVQNNPNGPVGKYQMTAIGNNLFLLDTTSGDTWILNPASEQMNWIKLPHPNR